MFPIISWINIYIFIDNLPFHLSFHICWHKIDYSLVSFETFFRSYISTFSFLILLIWIFSSWFFFLLFHLSSALYYLLLYFLCLLCFFPDLLSLTLIALVFSPSCFLIGIFVAINFLLNTTLAESLSEFSNNWEE